jgi:peptidoglycan/xylan/chitin deacetylase (PgdA/CDA1 family)
MNMHTILQKNPDVWALFTRREEYQSIMRDKYNRFSYHASKYREIFTPKSSEYLIKNGFHAEYPDNKPFAVCLTHDIDDLYTAKRVKVLEALGYLRNTQFSSCIDSFSQMRSKKLPLWNFSDIVKLEDRYDAKSSFYFMVQDRGDLDYNYDINDCESVIGGLLDKGYEVGLHGGHKAYNDLGEIKEKKKRLEKVLNKKVTGYRNHYLRFNVPETWSLLSDAGFLYDTTLGYNDCAGFRNGMCHPFKPFDLKTNKPIEILEIPLIIMDRTLKVNMNLDNARAWEISKMLIDTVEKYEGVLTVLWHNNDLVGEQRKFYEKILKYCAEKNAWMTSGDVIAKWWMKNFKDW